MSDQNKDGHSSGEYSGVVVVDATVAVGGKGKDIATVISSGESARRKRRENKEKKEKEEKEQKEKNP